MSVCDLVSEVKNTTVLTETTSQTEYRKHMDHCNASNYTYLTVLCSSSVAFIQHCLILTVTSLPAPFPHTHTFPSIAYYFYGLFI